ncbi:alpha/beta fold hydrolase [Aquirhabdus parva]|uniref:Alpha/beta hydrolase n=1 Tax=Aquirhabdus parva TaxID=2283318 RepID=A0A345P9D2_9GAMM|nr:alpha/beta hydrolase [Aquirhabdus parva]AXI03891.1 alpha/beta hydrolase [Aquirhabdus parva]
MTTLYFTTPAGNRLAYSAFGPVDGRPILFFHGGGQTRHAWGRAGEVVGELGWRAWAVDLRGHGDSDWVAGHYQSEDFTADALSIIKTLKQKPVIVGASLGGQTALLANAIEEVSAALVLVDITPRANPEGIKRILNFMTAHLDGFASLDEAGAAVAAYQPHRSQRANSDSLTRNLRRHADGRWYWHWDPNMLRGVIEQRQLQGPHHDEAHSERLYQVIEQLTQPILLVRGSESDVVSRDNLDEFKRRIPHARVVDVSGAGHMVAGDQNDVFLDAVLGFLKEV